MDELAAHIGWVALVGAIGGAMNALLSDNLFLLPATVAVSARRRVIRPGLALSAIVGGVSSAGAWRAFGGGCAAQTQAGALLLMTVAGALAVGALSARWITNEVDKRLLRAAAGRAALAPAAHPDTVSVMEVATSHVVFETASRLAPQRHRRC